VGAASIGVLDSGIGGLSVLREIHNLLPEYSTIYFADQFHFPYGPRPAEELQRYLEVISGFLMDQSCVVIVLACNTASAAALHFLRLKFPHTPFVGMEPAIKPAIESSRTRVVGVLSTRTTAEGSLYRRLLERYADGVKVITQIAPDLVQVAERQLQNTDEGRAIVSNYLEPLLQAGADEIVLACTHFPFLTETIQEITGPDVRLIDPSPAVARQVARVWPEAVSPARLTNQYFTSGTVDELRPMLKRLLGIDALVQTVRWSDDQSFVASYRPLTTP
jgi:glutamate racemase